MKKIRDKIRRTLKFVKIRVRIIQEIINHPLSKAVACGVVGLILIMHSHSLYAGIALGMGLREFLLAFK